MKKDVRIKFRSGITRTPKTVRQQLVYVLQLADDLAASYRGYSELQAVVGPVAWQSLSDTVYRDLLALNLDPANQSLAEQIRLNTLRLEDIAASTLVRDAAGLRETLARVLQFRLINGLATT